MLMKRWCRLDGYGSWTGLEIMRLMRMLTLGARGWTLPVLMLVVTCLEFVGVGTLLFWICIASSLPSCAGVNQDDFVGTAPDPLVWSVGALPIRRRLVHAVRDLAMLPGPPAIWASEWFNVSTSAKGAEEVARWPHSVIVLVKWVAFLFSLHWPVGGADLGVGGVCRVEMLILYELWAGERLTLEKAHSRYLRQGRPISVSAVPFGPGIDIRRSCRVIGSLMRYLCTLPGACWVGNVRPWTYL